MQHAHETCCGAICRSLVGFLIPETSLSQIEELPHWIPPKLFGWNIPVADQWIEGAPILTKHLYLYAM